MQLQSLKLFGGLPFLLSLEAKSLAGQSCLPDVLDLIHCRSWMSSLFGVCHTLAISSFEMVTAQNQAFLHWCDR